MRPIRALLPAALALSLTLVACSDEKAAGPDSMLGYIPADTPYAFANRELLPEGHVDAMQQRFGPLAGMYEGMIDDALKTIGDKPELEMVDKVAKALLEELRGNVSVEGLRKLGFDRQIHSAVYGIGLVPVMRIELKDEVAFRAFLGRVEGRVGEKLPEASAGDVKYWRVGKDGEQVAGLLAIADGDLVMSVMPANASPALIEQLLGIKRPEKSLLDDDRLAAVDGKFGFTSYGSGYIDTVRLFDALVGERTGVEQEFLKAFGEEPPAVTPECKSEMLAIAAKMPRLAFGYTKFDRDAMDSRVVLELEPGLAGQLQQIGAPVPGLGAATTGLVGFGLSLDVAKFTKFVGAQASAVAAAPFQCEQLKDLNQTFADMQTQLANPMVFAAAPVFKGLNASLTKFVVGPVPEFAGKVVLASDNPASLVALAANALPQIAALDLKAGGAPVALPADLAPPGSPPTHVALGDKSIGFAFGAGEEAGLVEFMAAPAGSPAPVFALGYSGEFFATIADTMQTSAAALSEDEQKEMERMAGPMRDVYGKTVNRIDTSVLFTETGLEMRQTLSLK